MLKAFNMATDCNSFYLIIHVSLLTDMCRQRIVMKCVTSIICHKCIFECLIRNVLQYVGSNARFMEASETFHEWRAAKWKQNMLVLMLVLWRHTKPFHDWWTAKWKQNGMVRGRLAKDTPNLLLNHCSDSLIRNCRINLMPDENTVSICFDANVYVIKCWWLTTRPYKYLFTFHSG